MAQFAARFTTGTQTVEKHSRIVSAPTEEEAMVVARAHAAHAGRAYGGQPSEPVLIQVG